MKVDVQEVSSFERKLQFSISQETIRQELDTAFRQLSGRVQLKGFRRGKVPRRVLEARFGKNVRSDVAQNLIQDSFTQAVAEHNLVLAGRPEVSESNEDNNAVTAVVDAEQ